MTRMPSSPQTLRCAVLALSIFTAVRAETSAALWSGLKYRMIGPERGGRVTAVSSARLFRYRGAVANYRLACRCSP